MAVVSAAELPLQQPIAIAIAEPVAPAPPAVDVEMLGRQARISAAASDAGTSIGWITFDASKIADQVQTIAAASEEVAASTAEIAARTQATVATAERARTGITACAHDMMQAGERMGAIEAHAGRIDGCVSAFERAASQIGEMASTIAAISAQTNLLALNATIEAARAGEVKALSAQTAKATEEIRARLAGLRGELSAMQDAVHQTREAVAAGVGVMQSANLRVETESGHVAEAAAELRELASVMQQQIGAANEISSGVNQIAEGTQKTKREISDAIGSLVSLEGLSRGAMARSADFDPQTVQLARLPADLATWRRRLAGTLVGIIKADPASAVFPGSHGSKELPVSAELRRIIASAGNTAKRFVEQISASNWGDATTSFTTFENEIAEAARIAGVAEKSAA
jgi:predicted  nucleic acid-binding Zn-ribbon protein